MQDVKFLFHDCSFNSTESESKLCMMLICADSSGEPPHNFALCRVASGDLWLPSGVKLGIQVTGGRREKCVSHHECSGKQACLLLELQLKPRPLRCFDANKRGVFSGRPNTRGASSDCFHNVSEHRMLPSPPCVFQAASNQDRKSVV